MRSRSLGRRPRSSRPGGGESPRKGATIDAMATAVARRRHAVFPGCPRPMKLEDDDYPPEKLAALRTVRKLVEFWNITPQELHGPLPPAPPPPPAATLPIRYRHPVSGETWDGQGEHPAWL